LCFTKKIECKIEENIGQFFAKTPTPAHPLLKVRKTWKIWWIFSESSKWHVFLVENRSFCSIFTFHLKKHIINTWNFAQLGLMYVWNKFCGTKFSGELNHIFFKFQISKFYNLLLKTHTYLSSDCAKFYVSFLSEKWKCYIITYFGPKNTCHFEDSRTNFIDFFMPFFFFRSSCGIKLTKFAFHTFYTHSKYSGVILCGRNHTSLVWAQITQKFVRHS
jgi:hypothetical protein